MKIIFSSFSCMLPNIVIWKYFIKNIVSQNKQRIKYTIAILHVLSKNLAHGTIAQSLYFVQNITGQTAFTSGPPVHISDTFRKRRLYRFCLFIRYLFYLSKKKKIFILIIFLAIIEDKNTCTIHARIYHVKCPFGVPHDDFQVHASLHGAPHQASSLLWVHHILLDQKKKLNSSVCYNITTYGPFRLKVREVK